MLTIFFIIIMILEILIISIALYSKYRDEDIAETIEFIFKNFKKYILRKKELEKFYGYRQEEYFIRDIYFFNNIENLNVVNLYDINKIYKEVNGLKLGDRVLVIDEYEGNEYIKNKKGKVINLRRKSVGICFDEMIHGHDCNGRCKEGYGWNVPYEILKKLRKSKYVKQLNWEDVNFYNKRSS